MSVVYLWIFWGSFSISLLCIARYGYIAATASDGLRKGQARLIAGWAFCSWFIVLPVLWSIYEAHLQVFEFEGTITSVKIQNHQSSHYSANLGIATTLGGAIRVHVSDSSEFWRAGQRLKVRYYGESGELIRATFLDTSGRDQGELDSTSPITRIFAFIVGISVAWGIWLQYRRDPEGRRESTREPSNLSAAVDQQSLLHLSPEKKE